MEVKDEREKIKEIIEEIQGQFKERQKKIYNINITNKRKIWKGGAHSLITELVQDSEGLSEGTQGFIGASQMKVGNVGEKAVSTCPTSPSTSYAENKLNFYSNLQPKIPSSQPMSPNLLISDSMNSETIINNNQIGEFTTFRDTRYAANLGAIVTKPRGNVIVTIKRSIRLEFDDHRDDVCIEYYGDDQNERMGELLKEQDNMLDYKVDFRMRNNEMEDHILIKLLKNIQNTELVKETLLRRYMVDYDELACVEPNKSFTGAKKFMLDSLNDKVKKIVDRFRLMNRNEVDHFEMFSIPKGDEICLVNTQKTPKEILCMRHQEFDCQRDGIFEREPIIENNHPNNEEWETYSIMRNKIGESDQVQSICLSGRNCYKRFPKVKDDILFQSYIDKFFNIYGYNPCLISNLLPSNINCAQIFLMLYERNKCNFSVPISPTIEKNKYLKKKGKRGKEKVKRNMFSQHSRLKLIKMSESSQHYTPCVHDSKHPCTNACSCACATRGFCEKYCACPKTCPLRFEGCQCNRGCKTKACPCFVNDRACDPDLCKNCHSCFIEEKGEFYKVETIAKCYNANVACLRAKRTIISKSKICDGFGLFALENINKGEYLMSYNGEILDTDENNKRTVLSNYSDKFYLFDLTEEEVIDSKYMGNKSRYMNHSKKQANCQPVVIFSDGNHQIVFRAKTNIKVGYELLFDYDAHNTLDQHYPWVHDDHSRLLMNLPPLPIKKKVKKYHKKKVEKKVGPKKYVNVIQIPNIEEEVDDSSVVLSDKDDDIILLDSSSWSEKLGSEKLRSEKLNRALDTKGKEDNIYIYSLENNIYCPENIIRLSENGSVWSNLGDLLNYDRVSTEDYRREYLELVKRGLCHNILIEEESSPFNKSPKTPDEVSVSDEWSALAAQEMKLQLNEHRWSEADGEEEDSDVLSVKGDLNNPINSLCGSAQYIEEVPIAHIPLVPPAKSINNTLKYNRTEINHRPLKKLRQYRRIKGFGEKRKLGPEGGSFGQNTLYKYAKGSYGGKIRKLE